MIPSLLNHRNRVLVETSYSVATCCRVFVTFALSFFKELILGFYILFCF